MIAPIGVHGTSYRPQARATDPRLRASDDDASYPVRMQGGILPSNDGHPADGVYSLQALLWAGPQKKRIPIP